MAGVYLQVEEDIRRSSGRTNSAAAPLERAPVQMIHEGNAGRLACSVLRHGFESTAGEEVLGDRQRRRSLPQNVPDHGPRRRALCRFWRDETRCDDHRGEHDQPVPVGEQALLQVEARIGEMRVPARDCSRAVSVRRAAQRDSTTNVISARSSLPCGCGSMSNAASLAPSRRVRKSPASRSSPLK